MDPSVIIAIVGAVGSIVGIFVANRYTSRIAKNAQITAQQIEERKIDVASWQDQVKSWRDDVKQLRELRASDRAEYEKELDEANARISTLERGREEDARGRARDHRQIDALVAWSRTVLTVLRNSEIAYPPPPPGVSETDPNLPSVRPSA